MNLITNERMMTVYEELNNNYDVIVSLINACLLKDLCLLDNALVSLKGVLQNVEGIKSIFLNEQLKFNDEEFTAKEVVYLTIVEVGKCLDRLSNSFTIFNDYTVLVCNFCLIALQILSAIEHLIYGVLDLEDEEIDDYIKMHDIKKAFISEVVFNLREDDLAIYNVNSYTKGLSKAIYS